MKKQTALIVLLSLLVIGNIGYTQYSIIQVKKQLLGVTVLQLLSNPNAASLYNEISQTENIKDKATRSLLNKRIVGKYAGNNGLVLQEGVHAEKG